MACSKRSILFTTSSFKRTTSSNASFSSSDLPKYLMAHRDELDLKGDHEKAEEIDQLWNGLILGKSKASIVS
jgi:ATP-dependent helicase/nuclease subunit B